MRPLPLSTAAALAAFVAPAFAQSSPAQPVTPTPRDYPNPNADMTPMSNGMSDVHAPVRPMGGKAPNGAAGPKARHGDNGN